jgi:hypothetical protein
MFPLCRSFLALTIVACASTALTLAQDSKDDPLKKTSEDHFDLTPLKRVTDRTFMHETANVSFTIPEGWKEIRPHRLQRSIDPRVSSVLGIERADYDMVASIYWSPIAPNQKLSDWIRDTPRDNEYGEEYETLKAVYGKSRVTVPVKRKYRDLELYRIDISGGPDRGEKYDGTLLIFGVESKGTNWLIRARVSYPKAGERGRNDTAVTAVLEGFNQMPPKSGTEFKKPEIEPVPPTEKTTDRRPEK